MSVQNSAYSDMATLLVTNVRIHHFENMATLNIMLVERRHLIHKFKLTKVRNF